MGQKRLTLVDMTSDEKQKKVSAKSVKKSPTKAMKSGKGTGNLVDKGESIEDIILDSDQLIPDIDSTKEDSDSEQETVAIKREPRVRSRRYKYARSQVDRTMSYPIDQAIELVKKTSISRFEGTITAHLNLSEPGLIKEVTFPHSTGKKTIVAIATDFILKKVEQKKIDFDILLATPVMMPKIAKVAKILGPMGLMPNPKNGTITDKPDERKKELEGGTTQVKAESKAPLMHVVIGKTSAKDNQLKENLIALVNAISIKHVKKISLASSMSPGVKVDLLTLQSEKEEKENKKKK